MGAGASQDSSAVEQQYPTMRGPHKPHPSPRLPVKAGGGKKSKVRALSAQEEKFQNICLSVFQAVDVDNSGTLLVALRHAVCMPHSCPGLL